MSDMQLHPQQPAASLEVLFSQIRQIQIKADNSHENTKAVSFSSCTIQDVATQRALLVKQEWINMLGSFLEASLASSNPSDMLYEKKLSAWKVFRE